MKNKPGVDSADMSRETLLFPSRRRFLATLTGSLILATSSTLVGCGGGSSPSPINDDDDNGGNGGGGTVSDAARTAAIRSAETICRELSGQKLGREAFNQALAARIAKNPVYEASGIDAETSSVWARFTDGRVHIIANNRAPLPPTEGRFVRAASASRAAQIPASKQARLLHSFGANFDGQGPVTDVGSWLESAGYTVLKGIEGDARVATLRSIANDGFFYFNTHGGRGDLRGRDANVYSIQSSTLVSEDLEKLPEYADDLKNDRLTYLTAANGNVLGQIGGIQIPDWDTRYAITGAFVEKYWQFSANSIVFINACYSGNTTNASAAAGFIFSCHKKGAGVYLGWTQSVSSGSAYKSIRYFADRLLGANKHDKEDPNQRAFDWKLVLEDMKKEGLSTDNSTGAELVALPRAGSPSPQILAPSIQRAFVDERTDELVLTGAFGSERGVVKMQGTEIAVKSWTPEKIVATLPQTGAGSAGDVQVTAHDHPSNVRRITEWNLKMDYTFTTRADTNLKITGPVQIRFRADVGDYRTKPGETPIQPVVGAYCTRDSKADLTASGVYRDSEDSSTTWTGSGTFVAGGYAPLSQSSRVFVGWMRVDTKTKKGSLGLGYGIRDHNDLPFTETRRSGNQPPLINKIAAIFGLLDGPQEFPDPINRPDSDTVPLPGLNITFGNDFTIAAGTFTGDDAEVKLSWSATTPRFPPDPQASRSVEA